MKSLDTQLPPNMLRNKPRRLERDLGANGSQVGENIDFLKWNIYIYIYIFIEREREKDICREI